MGSRNKRTLKAFAFDLGNTLSHDTQLLKNATADMCDWLFDNSLIQSRQAFAAAFKRINHATNKPFISHTFGEIEFFEKTFHELAINTISAQAALKKYREILVNKFQPDQNIVDTFRLLKDKDLLIALLSNERLVRVDSYLEKTNLGPFFDTIVVSEDIGFEKPDLRFFQEALHRLNISGDEMVMFGDNKIADGACKKLDITFVLVRGYMTADWVWEEGNAHPPDYVMERITKKNMQAFLKTIPLDR